MYFTFNDEAAALFIMILKKNGNNTRHAFLLISFFYVENFIVRQRFRCAPFINIILIVP